MSSPLPKLFRRIVIESRRFDFLYFSSTWHGLNTQHVLDASSINMQHHTVHTQLDYYHMMNINSEFNNRLYNYQTLPFHVITCDLFPADLWNVQQHTCSSVILCHWLIVNCVTSSLPHPNIKQTSWHVPIRWQSELWQTGHQPCSI